MPASHNRTTKLPHLQRDYAANKSLVLARLDVARVGQCEARREALAVACLRRRERAIAGIVNQVFKVHDRFRHCSGGQRSIGKTGREKSIG